MLYTIQNPWDYARASKAIRFANRKISALRRCVTVLTKRNAPTSVIRTYKNRIQGYNLYIWNVVNRYSSVPVSLYWNPTIKWDGTRTGNSKYLPIIEERVSLVPYYYYFSGTSEPIGDFGIPESVIESTLGSWAVAT